MDNYRTINKFMSEGGEILERIKIFFEKSYNDELFLLKGHLIIEEIFDLIIYFVLGKQIANKLNLNFYRKLVLVCGLLNKKLDSDLISQISQINKIRNKFAHNLDSNIKPDLIEFIRDVHGGSLPKTINRKSTYLNSLRRSFYFIFGQLIGTYETYKFFKTNSKQ